MSKIRVMIWNEFYKERNRDNARAAYPDGIHEQLKRALAADDLEINTAWLDKDEDHGLSQEVLDNTDVLFWWGHSKHGEVKDEVVDRIYKRVNQGMGLVVLHSGHHSKIFKRLMGTTGNLVWRDVGERCRVWCLDPSHPIAKGVPQYFELEHEEMYGERFHIPTPDDIVFATWWEGGELFRGGVTFRRGFGKIFYFHPGHETYGSFYNENVIKILSNAARWAAFEEERDWKCKCVPAKEEIKSQRIDYVYGE